MDNTQLCVDVKDRINKLLEYYCCFVLLKELLFFGVIKEVSFCEKFSHDVQMSFCLVFTYKLDDVGMMALL